MNYIKNKIQLMILTLALPLCAFANNDNPSLPKEGIKIVPLATMNLPDYIKEETKERINQQNKKGYFETNTINGSFLFTMKHNTALEMKSFANTTDPYDTHLKNSISQIKLAFSYNGIKDIEQKNIIGYSPMGSFKEGWTGIKTFFEDSKMGICSYSLLNMKIMGGGIQLNNESIRYDINKKPTTVDVEGSMKTGFHYIISWYDEIYSNDLECDNKIYDKEIISKMIILANKIDNKN